MPTFIEPSPRPETDWDDDGFDYPPCPTAVVEAKQFHLERKGLPFRRDWEKARA